MLDHVGVSVADLDRIASFYEHAFGFVRGDPRTLPGEIRTVLLRQGDGAGIELFERPRSAPGPIWPDPSAAQSVQGVNHFALRTEDIDVDYGRALAAGAQPIWDPRPSPPPWVRFAFVADPEGNLVELVEA